MSQFRTLSQLDASCPGLFQHIVQRPDGPGVRIVDQVHGSFEITEPLLLELLAAPGLQRLRQVHQHGITGLLGFTPPVTRYEHCVGAMLIVRKAKGSLQEQAFGLLHDVSHTALSHVVDWALSPPGSSYHEEHLLSYIRSTELPRILAAHDLHLPECMDESAFPLVEQPSPHLCADRLDYALRDALARDKLTVDQVQAISDQVVAVSEHTTARPILALTSQETALSLARAYLAVDREMWSNPAHIDLYRRTGNIIRGVVQTGKLMEASLWSLSDYRFWEALRKVATAEQIADMNQIFENDVNQRHMDALPAGTKIRTLDPDVYLPGHDELAPLSSLSPEYLLERQQYVASRQAMMEMAV